MTREMFSVEKPHPPGCQKEDISETNGLATQIVYLPSSTFVK